MQNEKIRVLVNFEDPDITELFSHIVRIHGGITVCPDDFHEADKIVTEAQYYESIPLVLRGSNCLIVGNQELSNHIHAYSLTRPLNQSKIETAMIKLLN